MIQKLVLAAYMGMILTLAYHGLYQEALAQQNNTIDESACLDKFAPYLETFLTTPPEKLACSPPFVSAIGHDGSLYCLREASIDMLQNTGWRLEKTSYIATLNNTVCAQPTLQINNSTFIPQSVYTMTESLTSSSFSSSPSVLTSPRLGFAVGGAADINNFRENVINDYLPLHTDITYEGLFYDYYFDTGADSECHVLFCPSYSYAVSADPFSNKIEYYLSVGLNSGIKEADFGRKDLNLVIVMDVSGSMDSPFYTYYYDASQVTDHDTRTKMAIANEAVAGLLDHLSPDDNLGLVLFDNTAHIARPLGSMAFTDVNLLKSNIMGIYADGGTNMAAGMDAATLMLGDAIDGYENRIIFLTDAMPNQGDTTQDGLLGTISDNAKNGIYTTFIGIGVDFNTELVEALTKIRGANHYSVHSASEFKNRMVDEFEFMVTPLVFDLELNLEADGYNIVKVYGSPEADSSTGNIMKTNTLFPSPTKEGQTRGGIILLKMERVSDDATLVLSVTYEKTDGTLVYDQATVSLESHDSDYYENNGIWKGILLSRYAELMKAWILSERATMAEIHIEPMSFYEDGVFVPEYSHWNLGIWERVSLPLQVSGTYPLLISAFRDYFDAEATSIGDETLWQELNILDKLLESNG